MPGAAGDASARSRRSLASTRGQTSAQVGSFGARDWD
jgi:hypothetical protein